MRDDTHNWNKKWHLAGLYFQSYEIKRIVREYYGNFTSKLDILDETDKFPESCTHTHTHMQNYLSWFKK